MSYQDWHDYARLSRQGRAEALRCPDDKYEYIYLGDADDAPRLWCPLCGSIVTPGSRLTSEVAAVVEKHRKEKT